MSEVINSKHQQKFAYKAKKNDFGSSQSFFFSLYIVIFIFTSYYLH